MPFRYRHHPSNRPAVFLDRDGTINLQVGHVNDPAKITLLPRAAHAVARLNAMGFWVVMVTNQSQVARGLATRDQVERVCAEVAQQVAREAGGHFDAVYYAPWHADYPNPELEPYRTWRKPAPGMILQAMKEFSIDLKHSWLVGDGDIDHYAAKNASPDIRTIILPSRYHDGSVGSDYDAKSLWEAVQIIVEVVSFEALNEAASEEK